MPKEDEFKYDPEAEENSKKYRLPFALCKAHGIEIQDWWTPRNAWQALRDAGYVQNVSDEYKEFYRQKKKASAKDNQVRSKIKRMQLRNPKHNPDKNYVHKDGYIADVKQGKPMTYEQADNGNVNPFFDDNYNPFSKRGSVIGYRTNCATCVATYVARRQGYDVRALPNLNNPDIMRLSQNVLLAYDSKPQPLKKKKGEDTWSFLNRVVQKDGSIFSMDWSWGGSRKGHIVVVEKDKNGVFVYDPQSNKRYDTKDKVKTLLTTARDITLHDLTGAKVKESFCDNIMKRRD